MIVCPLIGVSATASDATSGVIGGEYYIDTDPGQGNGQVTATGPSVLNPGLHRMYVRAQDQAGNWSVPQSLTFIYI